MKIKSVFYITITLAGVLFCECRSINSVSAYKSSTSCVTLVDTIVIHNPRVINPIRSIHFISFITSDSLLADNKYTEWKLLHMDKVYIEPYNILGVFSFLSDTIGISPHSLDSCFRNPNRTDLYGVILNVRADYYEKYFRATPEYISRPCHGYSRSPIYRPGYKYCYYKMLVEIPKEFYIDSICNGGITIPHQTFFRNPSIKINICKRYHSYY